MTLSSTIFTNLISTQISNGFLFNMINFYTLNNYNPPIGTYFYNTGFTNSLIVSAINSANNQLLFKSNKNWKSTIGQPIKLLTDFYLKSYIANYITATNGTNIPITISNIVLGGTNNYTLRIPTLSGIINKATLIVNITSIKTYDKTLYAPFTSYTLSGILYFDLSSIDISNIPILSHNTYDISSSYIVNVGPIILKGSNSFNYNLKISNVFATINPKQLIPYITITKVYDKLDFMYLSLSGTISGDLVSAIGYFDSNNSGNRLVYVNLYNSNISSLSFSATTNPFPVFKTSIISYVYSGDGKTCVIAGWVGYIWFSKYTNGLWSSFTQTLDTNIRGYYTVSLNYDGSILVSADATVYYSYWNGSNYTVGTLVGSGLGAYISPLTNFLVIKATAGRVYWSNWTGNGFTVPVVTPDPASSGSEEMGVTVSKDNQRIVFCSSYVYWADWNGTNFNLGKQINDSNSREYKSCRITTDKNVIFVITVTSSNIYYSIWNNKLSNYGPLIATNIISNSNFYGLDLSFDDSTLYAVPWANGTFYKSTVTYYYGYNNYTTNTTVSGIITKANIFATAMNKIYDNTNSSKFTLTGYYDSDILTISNIVYNSSNYSYYNSIYVGNKILMTISSNILQNYQIINTVSGSITPCIITSNFVGIDKIYDTTTNCQVQFISLSGIYFSDLEYVSLSDNYKSIFNSPNVGLQEITITGLTLYKSLAYNYNVYNISNSNLINLKNLLINKPAWGIYSAESFNNNILYDLTNNNRNAICTGVTLTNGSGNGASVSIPYLYGSTTSKIDWTNGSIPANFTICSITKYNGSNRQRILTGKNTNWTHGHISNTRGTAYYSDRYINDVNIGNLDNWLISCGKNSGSIPNNFMVDGVGVATAIGGGGNDILTINNSRYVQYSDWAFSHLLIWDQILTDYEMFIVSNFLLDHLSKNISLKSLDLPLYANILPKNITAYGIDKYYDGNEIAQLSLSGLINIERTDLILYYPFDGDVLNYASGTSVINGTLQGATLSTISKSGTGSLNGNKGLANNYFSVPAIPANTKGYTFTFWIYLSIINWTGMSFTFDAGTSTRIFSFINGGIMQFGTGTTNFSTITIPIKTWTHFVWTLSTTSVSNIYINGSFYTTTTIIPYVSSSSFNSSRICGDPQGNQYGISGYIDEFMYYNRILNLSEIEFLLNLQKSKGIFTTKNIGSNIIVNIVNNIPLCLNGTNYIISNLTTTANILQKKLINTSNIKVYDGTNIGTYSLSGIVYGDYVSISGLVLLSNSNVGSTILTICGYLDNPNYILQLYNYPFRILQKQVIPIFYVQIKVYDKIITKPVLTYTLSGIVLNDINNIDICSNFIGMYESINSGYVYVDISNIKLYGLQSMNYYINSIATVLTYINKYNIYGYPLDKIYDGTTTLLLNISGLLPNDTITYIANYNTKNVGTNNLLPATTDGPYNIIYSDRTANILPLLITLNITSNKVYDGLPNITLNFTLSGILSIDDPVLFTYLQPNYSVSTIGNYGIYPWSTDSNFIDISAQWIWTISGASKIAPLNAIGYQFQYLFTNTTNNIINATVHLLADDVCNFYLNGKYINSAIIGSYTSTNYSKININIPLGISIFEFESFNLGSFPNSAGILVSVLDYNNNILFRTDNSWVYSINVKRSSKYNSLIYVSNYYATISSIIENTFIAYYYGLTLSGPNSSNYYVINDGFYYGTFTNITLNASFYCNQKIYDKIIKADVTYSLAGILPEHIGGVDICSNYIAQYRHYNSSNFSNVDITNISLYGQYSKFYNINSSSLTTTSIDQRYLFIINGDKQYDKTVYAYLTLSNNIIEDTIIYSANFDDYYVGSNKIINITLSNTINESINNLLYKLSTYYTFNNGTINNQYIANYGNYNVVYDALLIKNINIDTSGMKIESGCLTLNYSNQEYLILPNNLTDNNGLTFSFWFKGNNTQSGSKIFELSNGINDNIYFGIYNNYIYCGVYNEISQDYFNFYTVDLNNNQWYHLVWILQTDNVWLIYVNNILVNTNTSALYPNAKLRKTNFIGKYFNGSIDDFRIYNRCLSNDDISNIYNNNVFNLSNSNYLLYQNTFYGSIFQRVVQVLGIPVIYNSNNTVTLYFTNKIETDNIDICNNYIAKYINFNAQKNQLIGYDNLTIYGDDYNSYFCSISGITYGDINLALLQVTYETKKYYDKNQYYTVYYTISGFYDIDAPYITLSSSIYGLFRSNLAGLTQLDISNIYLYGPYPYVTNYYLPYNKISLSGYIYQKYLNPFVLNKIYNKTYEATITLSGIIDTDFVGYYAQYIDYNTGQNKDVYVTLSQYLIRTEIAIPDKIYCPVITGFGPSVQPWSSGIPTGITGMVMNSDQTRMVIGDYNNGLMYFSVFNNGSWSAITRTSQTIAIGNICGLALSADGSRGVINSRNNYTYYFTWTGNNYSEPIRTLDTTVRSYLAASADMTEDGSRIVVSADYIYYADWNGTNYNAFTQISDNNIRSYQGCAISSDGDRIACMDGASSIYFSFWNGTNYATLRLIDTNTSLFTIGRIIRFTKDKKYLFASSWIGNTRFFYSVWNGFTYCNFVAIPETLVSPINNAYGLCLYDDCIYVAGYSTSVIYKIAVQSSIVDTTKINNNLLFHYTMDVNTINNNKLYNNITQSYDATLYNNPTISTTDYRVGTGSMTFNSANSQYIQIPSYTSDANGMSFSMWFRSNGTSNWARLFDFGNGSSSDNIFMGVHSNNIVLSTFFTSTQTINYNTTSNINDNKWRHIVWVINGDGRWNLYLDGVIVYTTTTTYPKSINRTTNYIGKSNWADPYLNGTIDDFRVYNRVLTISEVVYIRAHYNYYPRTSFNNTTYNDYLNYQLLSNTFYGNILPKPIYVFPYGINKIYDGTTYARINYNYTGIISGDVIDLSSSYIANFNDIYVATNKLITISNILFYMASGNNYISVSSIIYTYATISQRIMNINYFCIDKYYDTNTSAKIYYNFLNIIQSDISYVDISTNYIANYDNANSGINKEVLISNLSLYKSLSYNYIIKLPIVTISGNIIPKFLIPTVLYKEYDQTTDALVTFSGSFGYDFVKNISYYDTNQAGIDKYIYITISYIITISGISINNSDFINPLYTSNSWSYLTSISGWTLNKGAGVNFGIANGSGNPKRPGVLPSGFTQFLFAETLWDGSVMTITQSITLSKQDYILTFYYSANSAVGDFYKLKVTIGSNIIVNNLVAKTGWQLSNTQFNITSGTYNLTFTFTNSITTTLIYCITGIKIMEVPQKVINYQVQSPILGRLYQRGLIPNYYGGDKTYDGTIDIYRFSVTLSGILSGILRGDDITLSSYIAYYNSPNAGYQLITLSNFVFGGKDIYNYTINQTLNKNYGYISPKNLLIYYNPYTKVYDGLPYNKYSVSYIGFILGESNINLSGSLIYAVSLNTNNDLRNSIINGSVNYLIGGNKKNIYTIGYSYDGLAWFNGANPFSSNCVSFSSDSTKWIAVGDGTNSVAYSYNGKNWTGVPNIFTICGNGISNYGGKWFAVGQGTNTIAYSYDGISWIGLGANIFTTFGKSIQSIKNFNIAVGQGTNTIAYSYNGIVWIGLGLTIFDQYGNDIIYNNTMWLAVGKGTLNTIAYSYDGINWIGLGKTIFDNYTSSMAWNGDKWVAVGAGTINTMAYSYDGINWVGLGSSVFNQFGSSINYDGVKWLATGNNPLIVVYSYDGFIWNTITNNLDFNYAYHIECKTSILFINQNDLIDYGKYFVKPFGYYSNNYNITYSGDYTIVQKANLFIEPYSYHKIFDGSLNYEYGISYSGFKLNDSSLNLLGNITYLTNANPNVGTYNITISGLYALNYNIISNTNKITITKAPLVICANNFVKIYDSSSYTPTYSILVYGKYDFNPSLSGVIKYSGTYIDNINTGIYTIIPYGLSSNNYDIRYITGKLQIKQHPLLIIAKDDSRIYTNDISNYMLVYTRDYYSINTNYYYNQTTNNIESLINFTNPNRVWSLEGYDGPCEINFSYVDYGITIGLSEINYKTQSINYVYYFFNIDLSGNVNINENQNGTSYFNYINNNNNSNFKIKNDGTSIIYYLNNQIIRTINRSVRRKLYVNILFTNKGSRVFKLQFNNIREFYYGGNGLMYDGFVGRDTYTCLSGQVIYSGTSQNAHNQGSYTIIPSGLSSINYNIKFVNGTLKINQSILNPPQNLEYHGYINPIILNPYISKNYDGSNNAFILSIFAPNDQINFNAYYNSNQVGYNIPITLTINGIDASNYLFGSLSGNIQPIYVYPVVTNKYYDGLIDAQISLTGIINNEIVYPPYAYYSDSNVGNNKILTISGTIYGPSVNNYIFVPLTLSSSIIPLYINPTFYSSNKVYDETTYAPITWSLNNLIIGDDVDICNNYTSYFDSFNSGIRTIYINNISLYGNNIENYTILSSYTISGYIS